MIQNIQMKNIIPEVSKSLILKELTKNKFVRDTNYGKGKYIYLIIKILQIF